MSRRSPVDFYELPGIRFQEQQHGSGPVHWAAELYGLVMEIYPAKAADEVGGTTRLGFEVEEAASILDALRSSGIEIISTIWLCCNPDMTPFCEKWGFKVFDEGPLWMLKAQREG